MNHEKESYLSELDESDIQLIHDLLDSESEPSDSMFKLPATRRNNFIPMKRIGLQSENNQINSNINPGTNIFREDSFSFDSSDSPPSPILKTPPNKSPVVSSPFVSPIGGTIKTNDSSFDIANNILSNFSFGSSNNASSSVGNSSSNGISSTGRTGGGRIKKCLSVCLGGSDLPVGITTESSGPHFCSSLICVSCDFKVSRYPDKRWKKGTDYLFLRNNYPEKVQQNLIPAKGWCAYCCQCTFCEENEIKKLSSFTSNWVCRGHRVEESD